MGLILNYFKYSIATRKTWRDFQWPYLGHGDATLCHFATCKGGRFREGWTRGFLFLSIHYRAGSLGFSKTCPLVLSNPKWRHCSLSTVEVQDLCEAHGTGFKKVQLHVSSDGTIKEKT